LLGAWLVPLVMLLTASIGLAAAVLAGWATYCREQVPLVALVAAPCYIVRKLPVYLAFLVTRRQQWVTTQRDIARS
jgi:hypothetical protein